MRSILCRRRNILLALCWLTFLMVFFSDTAVHFAISIPVYLLLIIWLASLLVRAAIGIALAASSLHTNRFAPRNLLNFGFELAIVALSVVLLFLQLPTIIRVKLSESALDRYVREVQTKYHSTQKIPMAKRSVGLFEIRETEVLDGKIVRMITAEDFLDHAGLVYSPARMPPSIGEDGYRHLYGDWWYWHRSW